VCRVENSFPRENLVRAVKVITMEFMLKRAGRLIGLFSSLISLIICVIALYATVSSSANRESRAIDSAPGNAARQRVVSKELKASRLVESFAGLPLRFEENVGQFAKQVRFFCQGDGYDLALAENEVVLKLEKAEERKRNVCEEVVGDCERLKLPHSAFCLTPSSSTVSLSEDPQRSESNHRRGLQAVAQTSSRQPFPQAERSKKNVTTSPERSAAKASPVSPATVKMQFIGANVSARPAGLDRSSTKSNYFTGNDPKNWRTDVTNFASVKYADLYRGIDAIFYGNGENLEYDFILAPEADSKTIRLSFEGSERLRIDEQGDLIVNTPAGELRQRKPVAYQEVDGQRKEIACQYRLFQPSARPAAKHQKPRGQSASRHSIVGFTVGEYDTHLPLIIDPVIDFSTFLGGADNFLFSGTDIAVDAQENIYIVGHSVREPIAAPDPIKIQTQAAMASAGIFVAKIDSVNKRLVYITNLSGLPGDSSGSNSYVSTGIALDAMDNVYITGYTSNATFPTTSGAFQTTLKGNGNAFIVKLNPETSGLIYSTFLGGTDSTGANVSNACGGGCNTLGLDIAVDDSGNAYVTGETSATGFPTTPNAFKPTKSANDCVAVIGDPLECREAFVTKLNATGTSLVYSTFLGGGGDDVGKGITLDKSGNAYVIGTTRARDFPTRNALYADYQGGRSDSFLAKLNAEGSALIYSTYLGGAGEDVGTGIDLDSAGNLYLCGDTYSADLPTTATAVQKERSNPVAFKTTDGGASWKSLHKGLWSSTVETISVHPNDGNTVFLRTSYGIFKSTDGGASWKATFENFLNSRSNLTFAPQDPSVMLAIASGSRMFDTLVRSTDGGATWKNIPYPPPNFDHVSLSKAWIDPNNLSTIYLEVGTAGGGTFLLKTTDGGSSWKTINTGFPALSPKILLGISPRNSNLLFALSNGVFRSANGGDKWKPVTLDHRSVTGISFAPSNPATIYASGGGFFKSTDEGVNWSPIESNLSSFDEVIAAPDNASILYARSSNKVYKSTDGGKIWGALNIAPQMTTISALAIDPNNPLTLYAGTHESSYDTFVMKLNPQASAILYGTYLGGRAEEYSRAIAVDDFGNFTVVGSTNSDNFPKHNAIQATRILPAKAFVTKFNSTGELLYSTYLGGNKFDSGNGVATDKIGRVYVVGSTSSNQFPQVGSLQPFTGASDAFIARIVDSIGVSPEPVVLSVTPDSGTGVGQTRVTIKGANFLPGATVSIGAGLAQEVVVVDANTILATTPINSGGRSNIIVMNPGGQFGILEQAFNFLLTPRILQVMIVSNQLVITNHSFLDSGGYGFDEGAVILINGKEVKTDPFTGFDTLRSTKALKIVKRGQTVQLQVRNANGLLSNLFIYSRP
jgi:photosystem II stability/assembly factor-like uncharacterized protein